MKNKLTDLNMYLFEQIEKLNDEDLSGDELASTIARADKIADISKVIIENQKLQLNAIKTAFDCGVEIKPQSMNLLLGTSEDKGIINAEKV